MRRTQLLRTLRWSAGGLLALCLFAFGYDLSFGDGDGVIAKFNFNPLSWALFGGLILLLVTGVVSNNRYFSNFSLLLLSTIFALFVIEKCLPLVAPHQAGVHRYILPDKGIFPYTSFDTTYFKNYRPNCSFRSAMVPEDGGAIIQHHINGDGMRGPTIPEKQADEKRILLVGDSYIQAIQVGYESSIGPLLEQKSADSVHVLQHGFPSWSPLLEWNWVRRKGLSLQPDIIVLFLYANDFFSGDAVGDTGYLPYTTFDKDGSPIAFHFEEAHQPLRRNAWQLMKADIQNLNLLKMTSFALRQARARKTHTATDLPTIMKLPANDFMKLYEQETATKDILQIANWDLIELMRDTSLWTRTIRERFELSAQNIRGLKKSATAQGIPFVVCLIPYPWQLAGQNEKRKQKATNWNGYVFGRAGLQDALANFCESESIPFLDLYPVFESAIDKEPEVDFYFPSDPHWTARGHQVAADASHYYLKTTIAVRAE